MHNVFTEEINKIASSSDDDKRMQSINLIETYANEKIKVLVCNREGMKCNFIIKQCKSISLWLYYKRRHKIT